MLLGLLFPLLFQFVVHNRKDLLKTRTCMYMFWIRNTMAIVVRADVLLVSINDLLKIEFHVRYYPHIDVIPDFRTLRS